MAGYYISSDKKYIDFFELIVKRLEEIKDDIQCYMVFKELCGRRYAEVLCDTERKNDIKILIKDILRDIILINYKFVYFKDNLNIQISDKSLESLFFTSITLYDREYDSDILYLENLTENELSIDGIFRFCINDLLLRWKNVAEILQDNFFNDSDKEAIYEFVKHIIYSIPNKTTEVNIYKQENGYAFIDNDGKNIANFKSLNSGELASKIIFVNPASINFHNSCDRQTMIFLKNIFNDRIRFY